MDNKYVCQVCKKNFSCRQNLRRHRLNIHKGTKRSSSDRINDEVVPLRLLDLGTRSGKKGSEPPCFLQKFAYASVPEGTPHKFECAVTGHPRPSVTWFKDGDCIFDSVAEYTVTCYNGSCSLRLGDPDMYQEGRYTCRAENILGRVDCSAELECLCMHDALGETVSSKPHKCCHCGKGFSVETDLDLHKDKFHFGPHWDEFHFESGGLIPPRFIKKPVSAAVHEGEPHEFECQVNGMPLPTVSWFKDGICVNESLPDYAITYHSGTSTLQIRSDAKYEGIYTSRAENILTRVDCSVELKCLYRHDSSDESTKLYECRYCDQVFSDESDMPLHVDRFHFREACDDAFNLPIEPEVPEVKVHACMHCAKGFTYVKNLQKHLKSMHGTVFASSSAQQSASSETVKKVTSSETVTKVTSSETVTKLKPHKCCYCEKSFTVRANLQRHVKTYHSEIPMQGQFSYVLGLFSCHEEDCFQPTFRYAT